MQLTVDSTENLKTVLRAVEELYGIQLHVADRVQAPTRTASKTTGTTRRGGPKPTRPPEAADIRTWARDNGHKMSPRGRIPNEIIAAYRQNS